MEYTQPMLVRVGVVGSVILGEPPPSGDNVNADEEHIPAGLVMGLDE